MRLGKFALVVAAGLLVADYAAAQQPGGGRGGFGGGFGGRGNVVVMLGTNKQLQDELKMDKEEIDKVTEALTKVRDELKDDQAKLRDRQTPQDERATIQKKVSAAEAKAVEAVLKSDQVKRLHQIENQMAGIGVFNKEDVQKALKLTDSQKDKLDEINKELTKDLRDLAGAGGAGGRGGRGAGGGGRGAGGGGAFNPETITKRQELQKEAMNSAKKVLNDDQKTTFKDLLGAAFELQQQGFGGAGGFGGGRGQPGQVLSTGTQDQLKLTAEQKKKLEDIQKQVDEQLTKLLTEDQMKQLKEMQQGGGGRGGRGGRGGNTPAKPNP